MCSMPKDYLMRTVSRHDIHTRTRTVYYLYCPYCDAELDDDDISIDPAFVKQCPDCDKKFYIGA